MDHIIPHHFQVTKRDRNLQKKHSSLVVWFTGLSGSGKSTIANALEKKLLKNNFHTYILDGDNVRKGLNNNLTFSPNDRAENIRRIAEVAHLMVDAGLVVLSAFVSPYRKDRENVKTIVGAENFVEVYINTPIETCEKRDVKGLYAKARAGEIKDFTGIHAPYEAPTMPAVEIDTTTLSVGDSVEIIFKAIVNKLHLKHE
ncbi:MAG: adenylyl-sulfate kinase [Flavobacteriaceae bacterium]